MGALSFPSLDTAISQFENTNPSYNNPMAVQAGPFASSYGATGVAPNGLAIFQTPVQSLAAGDSLLSSYFEGGQNLSQAIQTYSGLPSGSQALTNYQNFAAQQTGIGLNEIPPIQMATQAPSASLSSVVPQTAGGGTTTAANNSPSPNTQPSTSLFGWLSNLPSFGTVGLFVFAVIIIIGGVFLLKPAQQIVGRVARTA